MRRTLRHSQCTRPFRMITKTGLLCVCALLLLCVPDSWSAPKNKLMTRNWGPQSMLYLKGRYGRRFASDYGDDFSKKGMDIWNAILKNWRTSPRIPLEKDSQLHSYSPSLYRLQEGYESSLLAEVMNIRRKQLARYMDFLYLD